MAYFALYKGTESITRQEWAVLQPYFEFPRTDDVHIPADIQEVLRDRRWAERVAVGSRVETYKTQGGKLTSYTQYTLFVWSQFRSQFPPEWRATWNGNLESGDGVPPLREHHKTHILVDASHAYRLSVRNTSITWGLLVALLAMVVQFLLVGDIIRPENMAKAIVVCVLAGISIGYYRLYKDMMSVVFFVENR